MHSELEYQTNRNLDLNLIYQIKQKEKTSGIYWVRIKMIQQSLLTFYQTKRSPGERVLCKFAFILNVMQPRWLYSAWSSSCSEAALSSGSVTPLWVDCNTSTQDQMYVWYQTITFLSQRSHKGHPCPGMNECETGFLQRSLKGLDTAIK